MAAAAARFVDHIAAVVLDEDSEGVHQARVGIRRLRSDLRTFGALLNAEQVRPLRDELRWLADTLGRVRDLDVLLTHLRNDASRLKPEDNRGGEEITGRLSAERTAAHTDLLEALRSERCAALLDRLASLVASPAFISADAERPAADVVPKLVARPLRRLRREADRIGPTPADEELHRVRILAKRLRYATDVSAPSPASPPAAPPAP